MGWFGYGLYDGDGTQTCHYDFIKWAIPTLSDDEISKFLKYRTRIPDKYLLDFRKGTPKLLDKFKKSSKNISKINKWNEDLAIEWQMLLKLFIDNDLQVPHEILVNGTLACHYLLGEHSSEFDNPGARRAVIKRFMKKVDEVTSVRARKEIDKKLKLL